MLFYFQIGQWHATDEYEGQVREITFRSICNNPMCPPDSAMTEDQHFVLSLDKKKLVFETVQQAHVVPFGTYFEVPTISPLPVQAIFPFFLIIFRFNIKMDTIVFVLHQVHCQWIAETNGENSSTLDIKEGAHFKKRCVMQSKIKSGAVEEYKKEIETMLDVARSYIESHIARDRSYTKGTPEKYEQRKSDFEAIVNDSNRSPIPGHNRKTVATAWRLRWGHNNVQELRDIWDSWKNDRKQKFSQRYGDIALLLHVKTGEPLIRALVQFWNPGYSCFTFNQEDMVPTIEEYTTLLHCENIILERAYIKHIKSQPFKNELDKIAGVDEKWVTDRLRHKAVVELFEQLPRRVNPALTILAETFRSLNHCRRTGGGRFIGCVQLIQVWIHSHFWKTNGVAYRRFNTTYSPLGEFITMKYHEGASKEEWMKGVVGYAPFFFPATYGLSTSEFVYHGDSYKKRIKEALDSWKKVSRMDVVATRDMLTLDYMEWRRLRKNDSIPMPDCEDTRTMEEHFKHVPSELEIVKAEFEAVNNELKQRVKELEAESYQWKLDADSQKDRVDKLEREQKRVYFELEDLRKGALRRGFAVAFSLGASTTKGESQRRSHPRFPGSSKVGSSPSTRPGKGSWSGPTRHTTSDR
ncbi:X1 [Hibiscus syriacus]|uniref:X1 n=1 Tax=Hibiscus syriacus TaxID=106335 RepID=A0A6A2XFX0_HIBSY|nr:X1 [Hibiscus syriacus]